MFKKSENSKRFYVTHEHFLQKLALFYHFFGEKTSTALSI